MKLWLPLWLLAALLLGATLWAGWLGSRHIAGTASILDRAETVLLDLRIQLAGSRAPPADVVIIAIDDETLARVNQTPLGRDELTRLLTKVRQAGARAVAIDILLLGATDVEDDKRLSATLATMPAVIAGAGQFAGKSWHGGYVPAPGKVLRPLPAFADAATVGLVNVATDLGGTPRQIPMVFMTPAGLEPSLVSRAVDLYRGTPSTLTSEGLRFETHEQPLDLGWHLPLNYYGPTGTIHTISAQSLLYGPAIYNDITGRLALVGVTATGFGDRFATPFDQILPGVEVLATGISNLLDGSSLIRNMSIRYIDLIAAIAITVAGMLAVILLPLATASVAFLMLIAGWLAAALLAFAHGYWLSGSLPLAASIPPVMMLAILRQVFTRYAILQLEREKSALSLFQSPALAKRIADDPAFLLSPKEQHAAILFIDLSGYTGLSERIGPARTRDILKTFHTLLVEEAGIRSGLVMDFMGDGAMIGFGIPDPADDDAANAVTATFALARSAADWIARSALSDEVADVRIGGHYGPIILSRLGHEKHQQIAATGDCVNVASRLIEVGKSRQASIALSSALLAATGQSGGSPLIPPRFETVTIRGRRQNLDVALWTSSEALGRH